MLLSTYRRILWRGVSLISNNPLYPIADHLWGYTPMYRGYSKLRTHTARGPYGISLPKSIGFS